ncbi:MAG: NADH-ubiquinone oxidoreductase-F iron-sulfur binding region domain-containing protein [Desulfovibrionales bacterium]
MARPDTAFPQESRGVSLQKLHSVEELERYRRRVIKQHDPDAPNVIVCCGTGCQASMSTEVAEAMREALAEAGAAGRVLPGIKTTGCHGFCSRGPLVVIRPQHIFYQQVKPGDCREIVQETIVKGKLIKRLQYRSPGKQGEFATTVEDIPYYNKQTRIALARIGNIDPYDINDAIAMGAYKGLASALNKMTPEEVIGEVKVSGIRGRGGAGFPAHIKWSSCARHPGPRYIICNADEGDPGAFMDRSILEGDPHSVIEGMLLAAYAVDSSEGYIYVRFEYPLAVRTLIAAIRQAEDLGLLGENILGSGLDFRIRISTGAGAFVCGESTALMASLEGRVGRPRAKYIRSVEKGFRGNPSNLNNVETYANIPEIIFRGGDWYASYGTQKSTGTKIFALTGDVVNVGLVEVPMGIPLSEIVQEIGGGIPNRRKLKAVQTGGPSGGCIPADMQDIPVDFEHLREAGSIMGSGGMIVMDENTCMVEVARYFIKFLVEESCGQCAPCREGLKQMDAILTRITKGQGREGDIDLLKSLSEVMEGFSLCGLGTSAPNPVLSTLRYFQEEYETHIRDKHCPAGVCKSLFQYAIDPQTCTGCTMCAKVCPAAAVIGEKKEPHAINVDACIKCGQCFRKCKFGSITIQRIEAPSTVLSRSKEKQRDYHT